MTLKTSARVRIALSATALIAAMAAVDPARAGDDGSGDLLDVAKGVLMFGITSSPDEKPQIDYRERAPLVLPKDRGGLPPPTERARRPDWPNDPDVAARAAAAAEARAPRSVVPGQATRVSAHELAAGRVPGGGAADTQTEEGCRSFGGDRACAWMHPDRLRSLGVKREERNRVPVGSEPDRAYLTQPPKGYRRVTQDTGGGVVKPVIAEDTPNIGGFLRNPFGKKDDDD